MAESIIAKAKRLLSGGRVQELDGARTFSILGDSGEIHWTTIYGDHSRCDCKAGQEHRQCSHALAAHYLTKERT